MKNFNFLTNLFSPAAGWQSNDVSVDRRFTVGSPSGFGSKSLLKLVSVLVLILTIGSGNAWGATATFTPSSRSAGTLSGAPTGATATYYNSYNNATQITNANTATLTLSGFDGCTITGVTINMKKSSKGTSAKINVTVNDNTKLVNNYTQSLTTTAGDKVMTLANTTTSVGADKTIVITVYANASSAYAYTYKISYEIAADPYTVSFSTGTGNPSVSSRTEASAGAGITLPSTSDLTPTCSGDGWSLYGWTTAAYGSSSTTTAPTSTLAGLQGAAYTPASDNITLYAVYKKTVSSDSGTSDVTFTHDNSGGWNTTSSVAQTGTIDGVTISTTAGTHNEANSDLRVNKNATFTVSSSSTISSIVFTSSNYDWSAVDVGSYSSKTWTGNVNSVTFTAGNGQVRMTEIVVTVSGRGDKDCAAIARYRGEVISE